MLLRFLSLFLIFSGYMLFSASEWTVRKFGKVTYEQIVFHLNVPMASEIKLIYSFLQNTAMIASIITVIAYFISKRINLLKFLAASSVLFVAFICFSWHMLDISNLINEYKNHTVMGQFYETHYVDPNSIKITSPKNKRNLIMIFAESMESTYANPAYFGDNLIPELTKIAQNENNVHFSDSENLGGFKNMMGAHYTQASMISQLCAIPLRLPINTRRFHPTHGFLPGAVCLSDILDKDGYNQSFMLGMTRFFSGTDAYLKTHGDVKILDWDFYSKRDHLSKDSDKKRKRIIRDNKLFEYAREEIKDLASKDKPFAFTIMTLDTHFGHEHFDNKKCTIKYHNDNVDDEENVRNVYSCSDKRIAEFVEWVKAQPFYKDTEIVIVGDHYTMGSIQFGSDWNRSVYDVYINPVIKDKTYTRHRRFTALDTLPTLLESMGYSLEGHKFGLGVSLFSGKETLLEEIGDIEILNEQLNQQSEIYNKMLYGSQSIKK